MEADILIRCCTLLPMDGRREVVEEGLIAIKNDVITYVGREEAPLIDRPPTIFLT